MMLFMREPDQANNRASNNSMRDALCYSFGILFFCVLLNQTFYFFFVPVFSIKQSSRSSEAAEDEKDQRTVTVNPSHMRKAFKVMNELRRYTFGHPLWFSGTMLIKTSVWET